MGSFQRGLYAGAPILLAVALVGVGYGVIAVEAGLAPWVAVASSILVVSAAAQFALVGLLAAGPGPALIAVLGLGLRHIPMSATLSQLVGRRPLATRLRLAWVLVDETFGLTLRAASRGEDDVVAYKTGADLMLYSGWVVGTAIGAGVGRAVDPSGWGIDVVFALLFLGLAAPLVTDLRRLALAGVAVGATLAAVAFVPPSWQVVSAATATSLLALTPPLASGEQR